MSEFKFACPGCQQGIQASTEYCGQQIKCPVCQMLLMVPADPNAPASGPRLSKAATSHTNQGAAAAAAATFYAAKPTVTKKSKTGLIVGLSLAAIAATAVFYIGPSTIMQKLSHTEKPAAAADLAPTNTPPPPPELTTEEILQKVGDTYQGLTDYAAKAQTVGDIDLSGLAPGKGKLSLTTTSSLQLGRTNYYRLEWEQKSSGNSVKGAAWNSGKGNFASYGPNPPAKYKTRKDALLPASTSFVLGIGIAELFFSDTNSYAAASQYFTKTNGPSLEGRSCYVLTGEANHQSLLLWVDKNSFLISQIEVDLGTKIDDAELKKLPVAQRNTLSALSKLKGTVVETYSNIQTNRDLKASAFESTYQPSANVASRSQRPSSKAGQLANPGSGRRRGPQPQ